MSRSIRRLLEYSEGFGRFTAENYSTLFQVNPSGGIHLWLTVLPKLPRSCHLILAASSFKSRRSYCIRNDRVVFVLVCSYQCIRISVSMFAKTILQFKNSRRICSLCEQKSSEANKLRTAFCLTNCAHRFRLLHGGVTIYGFATSASRIAAFRLTL